MNTNLSKENIIRIESIGVAIIAAVVSVLLLRNVGLLSGVGYENDHQDFVIIHNQLKNSSYLKVMFDWVINELKFRWQPIFYIEQVTMVRIFGLNWSKMYVLRCFEWSGAFALLYYLGRNVKVSRLYSFVFACIILIGDQGMILGNICTSGPLPIAMYTICILLALRTAINSTNKNKIFFVIVMLLTTLVEIEAYLVVTPILTIFYLIFHATVNKRDFKNTFFENIWVVILPMLEFAVIAIYILFGGNFNIFGGNYGAGLGGDIDKVINNIYNSFLGIGYLIYIFVADLIVILVYFIKKKCLRNWSIILGLTALIYFMLVELAIHSKKGMYNRYKLPYMMTIGGGSVYSILFGYQKMEF